MTMPFIHNFPVTDMVVDRYGRLKNSAILFFAQEIAGFHCNELGVNYEALAKKNMFWAVIRHRVQISRMPQRGEKIRVETWPMPTTRSAFPRSTAAYDEAGNQVFRCISLWVLMDMESRAMILPGKSGVDVEGLLRGGELDTPGSILPAKEFTDCGTRTVRFTDLDRNGHMNNTRYFDWIDDLMPSDFHREHTPREFTVCYYNEALEGQELILHRSAFDGGIQADIGRNKDDKQERVFSAKILY